MKLVSIITINFNQQAVTEALLSSICEKNTYHAIEVIVVDNHSQVNPVPEWRKKYPEFNFIRSERNLGFSGGNNLGIAHAKGDYLFIINNDTEVTANLISQLINTLEKNPGVGVVSPKIRYFDNPQMLQYTGYTAMNYFTARNKCLGQFEYDKGQYDYLTSQTGYAHGAGMMVSRKVLATAGSLADNFFLYYEELDWCERIKKAGYQVWVDMDAVLYHKESVSVGKHSALKEYYMNRNRILFNRKHAPSYAFFIFTVFFAIVIVPATLWRYIRDKQLRFISVFSKAIWWNLTNSVNSVKGLFPANMG